MTTNEREDLGRDVEAHDGIAVLRGGGAARGWNGIRYKTGRSSSSPACRTKCSTSARPIR